MSRISFRSRSLSLLVLAVLISGGDSGAHERPPAGAEEAGRCSEPATPIHDIQGSGRSSPLRGLEVTVDAIVVANFPGLPEGLGGLFLQEEDADRDDDETTSEGLFVFDGGLGRDARVGDRVRVTGRVTEFFGMTELAQVSALHACPRRGRSSSADVRLPLAGEDDWERYEGMRVRLRQKLVATGHHDLERFGEVEVAAKRRLWQPTHLEAPGEAARARAAHNARFRLLIDDGSDAFEPQPTPYLVRKGGGTLRLGDRLNRVEGVIEFAFGRYRLHPTRTVRFAPGRSKRPERPPDVGGLVRVASWNVENFFNGDGRGGGFPSRGAGTPEEFERQRAKVVETLARLDADVIALSELENDGFGYDSAVVDLMRALNTRTPARPYAVVDPGRDRLARHAIAVGILYRPDSVAPLGRTAVLDQAAHLGFDDSRNRPSLAQAFEHRTTGRRLTVVVNHFKSKGSSCDAVGDFDLEDGQGDCNMTRTQAAFALADFLAEAPTDIRDAPALVVGDFNAYPQEDPLLALRRRGYVDLFRWFSEPDAYTYVFDGAAGRLDHALVERELLRSVTGAAVWHVNADEPRSFDYTEGRLPDRYAATPVRASDHDPVLVGLFREPCAERVAGRAKRLAPARAIKPGRCRAGRSAS